MGHAGSGFHHASLMVMLALLLSMIFPDAER
jgi:hypothetical protein